MTSVFVSCSHDTSLPDVTPPVIKVRRSSVVITGGEVVTVSGGELRIGASLVASWTDNMTKECRVRLEFNGRVIASGYTVTDS